MEEQKNTFQLHFKDAKQEGKFVDFKQFVIETVEKYDVPESIAKQQFLNDKEIYNILQNAEFKRAKAKENLVKYLDWRKEYNSFSVKDSEVVNELKQNKFFWHGKDKDGVQTFIMKVKNIRRGPSIEEKMKFIAYNIDKMFSILLDSNTEQISIIWDREGFDKKLNHDEKFHAEFKKIVGTIFSICGHHFKQILVTHVNAFFQGLFAIAKVFLGPGVKKINLINEYERLSQWYEKDQLLEEQGGTSDFKPSFKASEVYTQQLVEAQ